MPGTGQKNTSASFEALLSTAPEAPMPTKLQPMKATLVREPFDDADWLYEIKWDGYRAMAVIGEGEAELISRNNISFNQFRPIADALTKWDSKVIIDGEIMVLGAANQISAPSRTGSAARMANWFSMSLISYGKEKTDRTATN